jgi:hypothetical protein
MDRPRRLPTGLISTRKVSIARRSDADRFAWAGKSQLSLEKRFTGYDVRYTKGEDCLTCAVISGRDGEFQINFAQDPIVFGSEGRRRRVASNYPCSATT